jgi:CheY-like chemotaxis protein
MNEGWANQAFRVLVVDDCDGDRQLTAMFLRGHWPFEPDLILDCANNGAEALKMIHQSRYTLLMLDWNMPGVDGHDLLAKLREEGNRIPAVVLTGQHRAEVEPEVKSLGAGYMSKNNMSPESFRRAVVESLDRLGWVAAFSQEPQQTLLAAAG